MNVYHGDLEDQTEDNNNFRQVLFTGKHSQLVVMSLMPGEDIGEEVHSNIDQFIRVESGEGKAIIGGVEYALEDGSAVVIPAGETHNVINTSDDEDLKLYSIYSPGEHKPETVHQTKADAEADHHDHSEEDHSDEDESEKDEDLKEEEDLKEDETEENKKDF